MKKSIYALAAAAAIVATPASFAVAAGTNDTAATPVASAPSETLAAPGTHYILVDSQGNVVGELVSESASRLQLRLIGVAKTARAAVQQPDPRNDRNFHPDYSRALTPGQMSAAWQAEMDRLFPQPVTGGG